MENNQTANVLAEFKKSYQSPLELYQHQLYAIGHLEFLRRKGITYSGLFMEMGTGKTKTMIAWYDYLLKTDQARGVLILCPLSVINTWIDEFNLHAPHFAEFIEVAEGTKDSRLYTFNKPKDKKIIITNYETLRVLFKPKDPKSLITDVTWVPDILILDESTRIKNKKAKLTQIALIMSHHIPYRYILSGKPITRNPYDMYSQMRFLDSHIFDGMSYTAFEKKISITQWTGTYKKVMLWRNLDWLQERVEKYSVVLDKKSASIKLPEKVYMNRRIDFECDEQHKAYKLASKDNLLWVNETENIIINNLLTKLTKLQQISSGFIYHEFNDNEPKHGAGKFTIPEDFSHKENAKLKALQDILDEIDDDDQMIIWCIFRHEIDLITDYLNEQGITNTYIRGNMTPDLRRDSLRNFKDGHSRILVAQIASACYGLNLANARYAVFFSNTFNFEHRIQAEDRIHRIGQDRTCYIIDILVNNTVDELVKANHMIKRDLMKNSLPEPIDVNEKFIKDIIKHFKEWSDG